MSGSKNIKERAPNSYNFQKKKAKMINVIRLKAVKMKSRTARAVHNIVALFRKETYFLLRLWTWLK